MYVQNMEEFVDDSRFNCSSDYKHDIGIIVDEYELEEIHTALTEWVAQNNIIRVGTVGKINEAIRVFLKGRESEDEED